MRRPRRLIAGLAACALLLLGTACTGDPPAVRLRVLASPELTDMAPLLAGLRADTGIELVLDHRGTVEASRLLAAGGTGHDLAWLSDDRYLQLLLQEAADPPLYPLSAKTMTSPVVFGIRPEAAARLRREAGDPRLSWADLADGAAEGLVRFGMADPRSANSGLSALVGIATAAAGTGGALRPEDVACDRLRGLFSGQTLTAPTSDALVDAFVAGQDETDALIGYESTLLALNASGRLREPLEIVYPEDGIVLSEYPLLLLDPDRRAAYDEVVAWLKRPETQRRIMARTLRRPVVPEVERDARLRAEIGNALYFPGRAEVVERLLADHEAARAPGQVVFVLDYSGSMRGARIKALRAAFAGLDGADTSPSGKFARFYRGERFILIRFGDGVRAERDVTLTGTAEAAAVHDFLGADEFSRTTAVWSALDHAYRRAAELRRADPARPTTVVLMTDGLSNAGIGFAEFVRRYRALPAETREVPTYAIRFGEADPAELRRAAETTGGRMVDATASSLEAAFKETRGCR
ncbi:Ca-activated chloride channel family protein [Actinocorallia herbida]|uniref:Ca-activated chloride channel family protein n=1 Tax=Actinocorallia herbida TaxID=58109 RepID=A0A3N1CUU6_9ACTN|nr:VWA domain-containing protein [Actinocorallia herbida]ROO85072.1 Ca-activated chloride channel family protein [Actinocorallia herbida]